MRLVVMLFILTSAVAEARVFSFKDNWVAGYFRGTGGLSAVGDDAYAKSSGVSTAFNDEVDYNFSGEIGFMFLFGDKSSLRVGIESLQTKNIKVEGSHSVSGDKLMDVESRVIAFNPNATFEYNFKVSDRGKFYGFAGIGYATVRMSNDYVMTADGTAEYPGAANGKEVGQAAVLSSHYGVGYEMFLVDNVTLAMEAGYRYLPVGKFEARQDSNGPGGAATKGATLVDSDGDSRGIDLGGAFVGIAFRFYIPPLH